jgi:hypothetical protein
MLKVMWRALAPISEARAPLARAKRRFDAALLFVALAAAFSSGCVTVRPEQRAILADPKMRFQGDPRTAAELEHAIENREGSFGGGSVQGGGCGCN